MQFTPRRSLGRTVQGRRESVFVIDKIDHLHQPVAPQLDQSLLRLGLDHVDLLVFHACSKLSDFEALCAPGSGFDQLAAEVQRGRARFRGISSHHPDVLLSALDRGLCDVVMFPLGPFVDPRYEAEVLPRARELGVGTVCFKTFGAGKLLGDTIGYQQPLQQRPRGKLSSGGDAGGAATLPRLSVEECVRYTLTLDPDVALLGLSFPNEQDAAFAAAQAFVPMDARELAAGRARAAVAIDGKGACWWNPA